MRGFSSLSVVCLNSSVLFNSYTMTARSPFLSPLPHPTTNIPGGCASRFHKLATVCFCPTKEAAKNALKAGLQPPQIRIHGLPIRPAFSRPMPPKVRRWTGRQVDTSSFLRRLKRAHATHRRCIVPWMGRQAGTSSCRR